jgi:hypothetical protein
MLLMRVSVSNTDLSLYSCGCAHSKRTAGIPRPLDYLNLAHANVNHIAELLSECAQEMPQKYLNLDNLRNASFIWIENRYMYKTAKFQLEDKAKEISKYLREYFITERLMERSVR